MLVGKVPEIACAEMDRLVHRLGGGRRRILLWGDTGVGKSTLAYGLVKALGQCLSGCQLLALDPGSPLSGVPGAVNRGWWNEDRVTWGDYQALCSLDAGRFRLPLIQAARRLMNAAEGLGGDDPVVIDPPGVTRGVGGAELVTALLEFLKVETVVALHRGSAPVPLAEELSALPVEVVEMRARPQAKRPPKLERVGHRTRLWDRFLSGAAIETFSLNETRVLGTPPPGEVPEAWSGRQVALLDATGETVTMGEVVSLLDGKLTVRMPPHRTVESPNLLIRDAGRNAGGRLITFAHVGKPPAERREPGEMTPPRIAPDAGGAPISSHVGSAWATLIGGVFGDPLLHVRLRHLKRSFLFDLGDPARLAAKVAHQVSAVFLSHAHIDHICGFPWFLRSRIGHFEPCLIFGPLGIIDRIESFIGGITWDRIGDNGPVFKVCEVSDERLLKARLQPGKPKIELGNFSIEDGVIMEEESFTIKAAVCDHNTPSVAYAFLARQEINVRKERLATMGLPSGPWLGALKRSIAAQTLNDEIELPNGTTAKAGKLADDLIIVRPGKKLVYAADMADTPENRKKLTALAKGAHTLYCETAFSEADRELAATTQHLTTRAAVEIARAAGVERLAPFHFSKRYEHEVQRIYNEILDAAGPVKILGLLH